MTLLDFLSPSRCEPGTTTSPLRRALGATDSAVVHDLWPDGKVEIRERMRTPKAWTDGHRQELERLMREMQSEVENMRSEMHKLREELDELPSSER